jgi:hypothetical protein
MDMEGDLLEWPISISTMFFGLYVIFSIAVFESIYSAWNAPEKKKPPKP